MNAAANWSASAERSGCTLMNRMAASRTGSLGSISCQALAMSFNRLNAWVAADSSSAPSRSRRAIADAHSTSVAHHTKMAGILIDQRLQRLGRRFRHQQGDNCRRVPELHRPSRRSSRSARTPEAPFFARGGLVASSPLASPPRAGRAIPSRTSRVKRLSSSERSALTGSSRATGRPAIDDQHGRAAFDAVDERAEVVLGFGNTGLLHKAIIALSK